MAGCLLPGIVVLFAVAMNALGIYLRSWEAWPVFLVGLGFPLAYLFARRNALRHLYRQHPLLAVPHEGSLSEQGFHVRSEIGENEIPWRYFRRVKADSKVMLLYTAPNLFQVIPRSFFENEEQFAQAVVQVKEWIRAGR